MMADYWHSLVGYLAISSPYLLVGLVAAGFIHQALGMDRLSRLVRSDGTGSVLWAAVLGVPLPLCSCSVIPAAATLKRSGASNGAVSSFVIATPESGADSILMTHAMMDLPMTLIRPVAAFATAVAAGTLQVVLGTKGPPAPAAEGGGTEGRGRGERRAGGGSGPAPFAAGALRFAFGGLIDDIAPWLAAGLLLGALIDAAAPPDLFLGLDPHLGRLAVLCVGVPLYICATSSTPIAASLVLKGMSPGTALLLLLVGPATNATNLVVLQRYLGKTAVAVNVLTIALVSLALSYGADLLYASWDLVPSFGAAHAHHGDRPWWAHACSAALSALLLKGCLAALAARRGRRRARCH